MSSCNVFTYANVRYKEINIVHKSLLLISLLFYAERLCMYICVCVCVCVCGPAVEASREKLLRTLLRS